MNLNYQLISVGIQNGYQSGDKLFLVDGLKLGKGLLGNFKRSSLLRLGFYDNGNMAEGIICKF